MTDPAAPLPLPDESLGTAPGRGRLQGRRILIVGGGSQPSDQSDAPIGNGRAVSVLAAREGARVLIGDRDGGAADETARLIAADGHDALTAVADVSDADACEQLVADAHSRLGGLDGLVINVGIGAGQGLAGTTIEQWDAVVAVNLRAHFALAKAAKTVLAPGSTIVFVGSVGGLRAGTNIPAYDATKAGLEGLMRHTAVEGAPLLRANLIIPGLIDTPLGRRAREGRPSRAEMRVPLRREGTGWEIAYAAIWLLSAESAYVTGQHLVVDGGLTAS
jgi:NAD(P)-dependent dehydrogenase (short-subunit alcohol dehydrogenase family)